MKRTFILALFSFTAFAQDVSEIQKLGEAFLSHPLPTQSNLGLEWEVVRVRAILEMQIKIPLISKASLNPEVELYFVKK